MFDFSGGGVNAAVLWYTNKERPRSLRAAGAFAQAVGAS